MSATVRIIAPFAAAGLAALALPWSSASAGEQPAFSGYNSSAWAAPVKVELYEPTIPIPADPQLEVEMAYTRVEAETGLGRGRGSWLWPGDPLGEGAKTFVEQLGLPKELGERGYPVQVNSTYPTGPETQADEPFPGTIMRTSADQKRILAEVGFSPDGQAQEPGAGGDGGGGGTPGPSGLPEIPGLPTGDLEDFGAAITGSAAADEPEPGPAGGAPGMPEELAALVDFTGYTSMSSADTGTQDVSTVSRSALSDVSLLGGLITIEGVHSKMVTSSNGKTATAEGSSHLGTMTIAGNAFTIGPDGVEAAGQQAPIPGLPDDPAKALAQLGVQLAVPKPQLERSGDASSGLVQGLRIEIDTHQLHSQIGAIPLGDIIGAIPDEAKELKGALQAATGLSPRIVLTLGNSGTATDTVQAIEIPDVPVAPAENGAGAAAGAGAGSGGDVPPVAPGAPADSGSAPTADGDLADAAPMGSGLPPLNSIPGALTVAGIGLAAAAGTWLRKIGVVALGGTGSCPHGLDSGLPDLRKA